MTDQPNITRRNFIRTTSGVLAAGATLSPLASRAWAQGNDQIKIALIGCGGRGNGAVNNNLKASEGRTKIVAVADAFESNAKKAATRLKVSADKTFWGLDAYRKAINAGVDMVILATPPGFRPVHYKAAIEAGKHVFMEKPCCVDAPGYRMLQETNALADQAGLKVGVGLQRRHASGYVNGIKKIHDGKYGDLVCLRAYWNGAGIWWRGMDSRKPLLEQQVHNWYHFNWICGDNICEQHVHNIDVCNWAKNAHPVEANGMGGGEVRKKTYKITEIFDHHFVEFTYADGSKMYSQCRQNKGTFRSVSEYIHGTKGHGKPTDSGNAKDRGGADFKFRSPYDQEHYALLQAIWNNKSFNEGHYGATSSFTAVLGRMATYSGKKITWDEAVEKGKQIFPYDQHDRMTWRSKPPVLPDKDGQYPHPMPGKYNPFA